MKNVLLIFVLFLFGTACAHNYTLVTVGDDIKDNDAVQTFDKMEGHVDAQGQDWIYYVVKDSQAISKIINSPQFFVIMQTFNAKHGKVDTDNCVDTESIGKHAVIGSGVVNELKESFGK